MATVKVSAKRKEDAAATEVEYELGATLDELTAQFGADVVATKARQSIVIDLQAFIRRQITPDKEGKVKPLADIQAAVKAWKPDNRTTVKKSAAEKANEAISALSPEERAELLKKLKAGG